MSKLEIMLELERRGKLPDDRQALLNEARKRGLIPQLETSQDELVNPDRSFLQQASGATQNLLQGASFGLADGARGAVRGLGYGIGAGITGREPIMQAAQRGYREGTDIARQEEQQFAQEMPKTALAANIAGGFANPLNKVGGQYIGRGANALQKLARSIGVGAVSGAGYGAGSAVENERLKGAGSGAISGAVLPAVLGVGSGGLALAKKGLPQVLGVTTGAGSGAIKQAVKAGEKGSKSFIKNLRGEVDVNDVIAQAKNSLNKIKEAKNIEYKKGIGTIFNDPTKLSIKPIQKKATELIQDLEVGGFSKVGGSTASKIDDMINVIAEFETKTNAHTAEGFDALKRRIKNIDVSNDQQALRIKTNLTNEIKKTINNSNKTFTTLNHLVSIFFFKLYFIKYLNLFFICFTNQTHKYFI